MDKMTNVKALEFVLENATLPEEVKEKISNIHASYLKKSAASGERKPTERQKENAAIMEQVAAWLNEQTERYTVADLLKACPACADIPSTQRLTPILSKAVEAKLIGVTNEKRRNYYHAI